MKIPVQEEQPAGQVKDIIKVRRASVKRKFPICRALSPEKVCTESAKNDKITKAISKNEEGYTMSKFLKLLVNLFLICAILITGAIFLPPMLGVNTTVVDSQEMDTNLPVGSITYSRTTNVLELQSGDEVLKEVSASVHAYIIETGDVNTGKYTVRDAIDGTAGTTEISLRNNVSKVVLTVPYLGYVVMIMQTTEGMIIAILIVVFVIILFVLSELWKHNEEEDEADEEDVVDDDGEQVEEILDEDEAREALESAGAQPFVSEPAGADAGTGTSRTGGDTKEVKIAAAPDTSVEVRRGDTAFLMSELASLGTVKDDPMTAEAPSEDVPGERGTFFAGESAENSPEEEKAPETDGEELQEAVPADAAGTETDPEGQSVKTETAEAPASDKAEEMEDGIDWTKFEVGEPPEEKAAGMTEPASDAAEPAAAAESVPAPAEPVPAASETGKKYAEAAAAKVGEKAVKPAPGKPARRFRPVERLTLEEILEHAKKSGAADETQASRDEVTGVDFVDYSELL